MEKHVLESPQSESALPVAFAPRLIIETEPAYQVFFRNLSDTLFPRRVIHHEHGPEWPEFWRDVFVSRRMPWWSFVESVAVHLLFVAALWGASRMWALRPQALPQPVFSKNDVIYFPASEYLPPLDTGSKLLVKARKGEPEYSRQTIISVPPEADNRTQTVVTPPDVKLTRELPLPNIVAWKTVNPSAPIDAAMRLKLPAQQPMEVIAPAPSIEQATDRRRLQPGQDAVIAPPPELAEIPSRHAADAPRPAVIEPPPPVQGQFRQFGEINIGHTEIVPPAPELVVREQRTISYASAAVSGGAAGIVPPPPTVARGDVVGLRSSAGTNTSVNVVPPPPSVQGAAHSQNRIVALGLHPVEAAPPVASGNRRGSFAMSPNGKPGAPGTPDIKSGVQGGSAGLAHGSRSDLPSGLLVQPGPAPATRAGAANAGSPSDGTLVAEAKPPLRVTPAPRRAMVSTSAPTAEERAVFADRKFYSMTLNMPNLNSAGGSWVIRFAELKDNPDPGDLTAPEALRKVDPAYPLELMRTQIEGKVTLYAVIHSDGSVGDVRVLTSIDDRLDEYARAALSRWRFRPATKSGTAVALEAVVTIPFRARSGF
jgi:TonB family protein